MLEELIPSTRGVKIYNDKFFILIFNFLSSSKNKLKNNGIINNKMENCELILKKKLVKRVIFEI
tara:strand:+ start:112 stop:303 length:192 start_codon:yes stop_codon:yes gene_type:complete